MKEKTYLENFSKGIIKENPVLVLLLGLCPALGVTSTVANGLGMGIAATFVLIGSNVVVSLLKDFIPEKVRIPGYIVVIAAFVTIIDLILKAFIPGLAKSLGVFLPLIVVNCIILGRAEAFANKNNVSSSFFDGLGMGLGFTGALFLLGFFREFLGALRFDFSNFGGPVVNFFYFLQKNIDEPALFIKDVEFFRGIALLSQPAGAFFVMGIILAVIAAIKNKTKKIDI